MINWVKSPDFGVDYLKQLAGLLVARNLHLVAVEEMHTLFLIIHGLLLEIMLLPITVV